MILLALAGLLYVLFGSPGGQPSDPIAQAAKVSAGMAGYRLDVELEVSSRSIPGEGGTRPGAITAFESGDVDLRDDEASMRAAIDFADLPQITQALGSTLMQMGVITRGQDVYVSLPAAVVAGWPGSDGKPWVKVAQTNLYSLPGFSSLASNPGTSAPSNILQYLEGTSGSVQVSGPQELPGYETTHYRGHLGFAQMIANVPFADRVATQRELSLLQRALQGRTFQVDAWIDQEHLVRRAVMTINLGPPHLPPIQELVDLDLSRYGSKRHATPPPSGEVQDLSRLAAGGFPGSWGIAIAP